VIVIVAFTAFAAGAVTGAWITRRRMLIHIDQAHYNRVRLEATRVDQLARENDHNARLARRLGRALAALRRIDRVVIGDLLDKVAQRDRVIADLRGEIDRLTSTRHLRPARRPSRKGVG